MSKWKRRFTNWQGVLALAVLLPLIPTFAVADTADGIEDGDVTQAIENQLWLTRGVTADAVDVVTTEGIVTLRGETDNILAKERAEHVASTIKGVRSIINEIQVESTDQKDGEIQRNIVEALAQDPATDSWEVDARVRGGEVTLTGTVQSWQEKKLVETVAKGVRGVRSVSDQIQIVYPAERSDAEIRAEIERSLLWDIRVNDALIDVAVHDGAVVLEGSVGSVFDRNHAIANAWVTGVESVDAKDLDVEWLALNEMTRRARYTDKDDQDVRQAVKDAMLYDPRVASFRPEVDVDGGIVTLTGIVDNLKAKRAAAQDAANTVGVWRVRNYLKVRPEAEQDDAQIAASIRSNMTLDPYVERFDVDVSVDHGVAYLHGDADTYFEKWHAGDIASRVPGVVSVKNRLKVDYQPYAWESSFYDWNVVENAYDIDYEPMTTKSDWMLQQDIQSELIWSPFVDEEDVRVMVADGIATLQGSVDSWTERNEATEQAFEGGAVAVDNNLTVEWGPDVPIL